MPSTTAQTAFNTANVIIGISFLVLPFAFRNSGFLLGISLLVFFGYVTSVCARLLACCQLHSLLNGNNSSNSNNNGTLTTPLITYGDIGARAFGLKGRLFIQLIFILELFSASVALLLLICESISSLSGLDSAQHILWIKLVTWAILTVLTWPRSLSVLSYGSLLGVLCVVCLLFGIVFDGVYNQKAPGSLWQPAHTTLLPDSLFDAAYSLGLLISGFAGAACFPGFYVSMSRPQDYPKAIKTAFGGATLLYIAVGTIGYLMFGEHTPRLFLHVLQDPVVFPKWIYVGGIVVTVVNSATKFPLTMYPILMDFEAILFGKSILSGGNAKVTAAASNNVATTPSKGSLMARWFSFSVNTVERSGNDDDDDDEDKVSIVEDQQQPLLKTPTPKTSKTSCIIKRILFRTVMCGLVLFVAVLVPSFDIVLALLGSLFSTTSSVLFPILCWLSICQSSPFIDNNQDDVERRHQHIAKRTDSDQTLIRHENTNKYDSLLFVTPFKKTIAVVTLIVFFFIAVLGTAMSVLRFN